jgi:hypothetical protein
MQPVRLVATYVAWWIASFWLWLVYQGEWNRIEWVAAAGAATLAAALATALARRGLLGFRVPLGAAAGARSVPLQIVVDFWIVTVALLRRIGGRRVRGKFVIRALPSAGSGAVAAGDRAARGVLATYSPNAYVVDLDPGRHTALLHDLVPNRRSEAPL